MPADRLADRQRIVKAAAHLLAEEGAGWSMTHLAETAGLSRGALYRAYPFKAAVFTRVLGVSVSKANVKVLESVRWGTWRPTSLAEWRRVLAVLTGGNDGS